MPELSRFFGIIIYMYFNDVGKHYKPHIHAKYGEYEIVLSLDGEILEGAMPKRQLALVGAWIALHEEELYKAWIKAVRQENPDKIEPLKG